MAASQLPARAPGRQLENTSGSPATWPRSAKKPTRFVIKVGGVIPG
jgi:hypothetical protein